MPFLEAGFAAVTPIFVSRWPDCFSMEELRAELGGARVRLKMSEHPDLPIS
jgi:hypothetical protein